MTIPPNFFELPILEKLYLSGNSIEKITENFGKLSTSLRILALRDNKINFMHPDISKYDLHKYFEKHIFYSIHEIALNSF